MDLFKYLYILVLFYI